MIFSTNPTQISLKSESTKHTHAKANYITIWVAEISQFRYQSTSYDHNPFAEYQTQLVSSNIELKTPNKTLAQHIHK